MKKTFSKYWRSSKQPRKQRKYLAEAPFHIKRKFLSANLNKELRKRYKKRSFPLRKGDSIKIMVGSFKGKTGKITGINPRTKRVSIEGIQRAKRDGTKINIFFEPSNLQIQELNLEDKKRIKSIERNTKQETKKIIKEDKSSIKKTEQENK